MSYYIHKRDLYDYITQTNLEEIADKDRYIDECFAASQQELISYLSNFYDTDTIFALNGVIVLWDNSTSFNINDRIYWEEDIYVPTDTYNTDDYVSYDDGTHTYIYKCKEDGVTGVWNSTKWTKGYENSSHLYSLTDSNSGNKPDDTTNWQYGNPQNAKLREVMADITIYSLHARVNPVQIPEFRIDRRDQAIDWLKQLNRGEKSGRIKAELPRHTTYTDAEKRAKIEYGSHTKQTWR